MDFYTEQPSAFVIVRVTRSGKLYFYTGKNTKGLIGESWTNERSGAKIFATTHERAVKQIEHIPVSSKDSVIVIPEILIDGVVRWEYDRRGRERRKYREERQ